MVTKTKIVAGSNGLELEIVLKKKQEKGNLDECIKLINKILLLSNFFRNELIEGKNPGKKMNQTRHIRKGIDNCVNREGAASSIVDDIIYNIRQGNIETITLAVNGKDEKISALTEIDKLMLSFA